MINELLENVRRILAPYRSIFRKADIGNPDYRAEGFLSPYDKIKSDQEELNKEAHELVSKGVTSPADIKKYLIRKNRVDGFKAFNFENFLEKAKSGQKYSRDDFPQVNEANVGAVDEAINSLNGMLEEIKSKPSDDKFEAVVKAKIKKYKDAEIKKLLKNKIEDWKKANNAPAVSKEQAKILEKAAKQEFVMPQGMEDKIREKTKKAFESLLTISPNGRFEKDSPFYEYEQKLNRISSNFLFKGAKSYAEGIIRSEYAPLLVKVREYKDKKLVENKADIDYISNTALYDTQMEFKKFFAKMVAFCARKLFVEEVPENASADKKREIEAKNTEKMNAVKNMFMKEDGSISDKFKSILENEDGSGFFDNFFLKTRKGPVSTHQTYVRDPLGGNQDVFFMMSLLESFVSGFKKNENEEHDYDVEGTPKGKYVPSSIDGKQAVQKLYKCIATALSKFFNGDKADKGNEDKFFDSFKNGLEVFKGTASMFVNTEGLNYREEFGHGGPRFINESAFEVSGDDAESSVSEAIESASYIANPEAYSLDKGHDFPARSNFAKQFVNAVNHEIENRVGAVSLSDVVAKTENANEALETLYTAFMWNFILCSFKHDANPMLKFRDVSLPIKIHCEKIFDDRYAHASGSMEAEEDPLSLKAFYMGNKVNEENVANAIKEFLLVSGKKFNSSNLGQGNTMGTKTQEIQEDMQGIDRIGFNADEVAESAKGNYDKFVKEFDNFKKAFQKRAPSSSKLLVSMFKKSMDSIRKAIGAVDVAKVGDANKGEFEALNKALGSLEKHWNEAFSQSSLANLGKAFNKLNEIVDKDNAGYLNAAYKNLETIFAKYKPASSAIDEFEKSSIGKTGLIMIEIAKNLNPKIIVQREEFAKIPKTALPEFSQELEKFLLKVFDDVEKDLQKVQRENKKTPENEKLAIIQNSVNMIQEEIKKYFNSKWKTKTNPFNFRGSIKDKIDYFESVILGDSLSGFYKSVLGGSIYDELLKNFLETVEDYKLLRFVPQALNDICMLVNQARSYGFQLDAKSISNICSEYSKGNDKKKIAKFLAAVRRAQEVATKLGDKAQDDALKAAGVDIAKASELPEGFMGDFGNKISQINKTLDEKYKEIFARPTNAKQSSVVERANRVASALSKGAGEFMRMAVARYFLGEDTLDDRVRLGVEERIYDPGISKRRGSRTVAI